MLTKNKKINKKTWYSYYTKVKQKIARLRKKRDEEEKKERKRERVIVGIDKSWVINDETTHIPVGH